MQTQELETGFVEKTSKQIDKIDENQLKKWERQVEQFYRWLTLGSICQRSKLNEKQNFRRTNLHGETVVDRFSIKKLLLTEFVCKSLERPWEAFSTVWRNEEISFLYLEGRQKLFWSWEKPGKYFKGQQTQKLYSLNGKHHETHFVHGRTTWNPFFQVHTLENNFLEKKTRKSNLGNGKPRKQVNLIGNLTKRRMSTGNLCKSI